MLRACSKPNGEAEPMIIDVAVITVDISGYRMIQYPVADFEILAQESPAIYIYRILLEFCIPPFFPPFPSFLKPVLLMWLLT
jgi:hypothetical protein